MAINSISSGSNPYVQSSQLQSGIANAFKQRKQDFTALANALGSGDLKGAGPEPIKAASVTTAEPARVARRG